MGPLSGGNFQAIAGSAQASISKPQPIMIVYLLEFPFVEVWYTIDDHPWNTSSKVDRLWVEADVSEEFERDTDVCNNRDRMHASCAVTALCTYLVHYKGEDTCKSIEQDGIVTVSLRFIYGEWIATLSRAQRSKQFGKKGHKEAGVETACVKLVLTGSNNRITPILIPRHPPSLKHVQLVDIDSGVQIVSKWFRRSNERVYKLSSIRSQVVKQHGRCCCHYGGTKS